MIGNKVKNVTKDIEILFTLDFTSNNLDDSYLPKGPLFSQSVPETTDILKVATIDPNISISLWVEAKWKYEQGKLTYSETGERLKESEIDGIYPRDGGPIKGSVSVSSVDEEVIKSLTELQYSEHGKELAERVAKHLQPVLDRLLALIKNKFGQFWAPVHPSFFIATSQVGNYFGEMYAKWRVAGSDIWLPFWAAPREHHMSLKISIYPEHFFLSLDDWKNLEYDLNNPEQMSLAYQYMAKAAEQLSKDDLSHAFVDAGTALEIASNWYLSQKLPSTTLAVKAAQAIKELPKSSRYLAIAALMGIDEKIIEKALAGIKERNDLVHERKLSELTESDRSIVPRIEHSKAYLDADRRYLKEFQEKFIEAQSMIRCMLVLGAKFLGYEHKYPAPVEGTRMESWKDMFKSKTDVVHTP
jgi:hypothetical protein